MTSPDYSRPAASIAGAPMPLLGFGTWQISDADAERAIGDALEVGYRHIDTATMYRNESGIGRALAVRGAADVFVTTKMLPAHAGRERATIEESLAKLRLDAVDLWLVHSPPSGAQLVSVWEAFIEAQEAGFTRAIGVSNFSLEQIDTVTDATGVSPAVNQVRWSPAIYDDRFATGLEERGVVLEGYSPFKAGDLHDDTLVSIADAHDATPAQVIVAWHVALGFVVIPKTSSRERMIENAGGATLTLSVEQLAAVTALSRR